MRIPAAAFCLLLPLLCLACPPALSAPPAGDLSILKNRIKKDGCAEETLSSYTHAAHNRIMTLIPQGALDDAGKVIVDFYDIHETCPGSVPTANAFISANAVNIAALCQGTDPELARPFLSMQRRAVEIHPDKDLLGLLGRNLRQFGEAAGDETAVTELFALAGAHPDNDLLGAELADAWCGKYITALRNVSIEKASPLYQQILQVYERFPENLTIRDAVGRAIFQTVLACKRKGWLTEAESWCDRLADFADKHREPKIVQVLYGHAVKALMETAWERGGKEGLAVMERWLPALETLAERYEGTRSLEVFLSQGLGLSIAGYAGQGELPKAKKKLERLKKLSVDRPDDAAIRKELDRALTLLPD